MRVSRHWRLSSGALAPAIGAALAWVLTFSPGYAAAPSPAAPLSVKELAPGLYAHRGHDDVATPRNGGDIANIGFVIGTRCVAVIDTGGTLAEGRALRAAIRRATPLPVCYVINTHMHPDHIFGNAAFLDDHPQFVGSDKLPEAELSHSQSYLHVLTRELGSVAAGSRVIPPTLLVHGTLDLDLGSRVLTLQTWKTAHTNSDLTVYDKSSGTLWLADLLFAGCLPVVDGSVAGWLDDLAAIRALPGVRRAVPGHGPLDAPWPQALDAERGYLERLANDVRAAIRAGRTMRQAIDTIGANERPQWKLFDVYQRRNVTTAYAELEWEP